VHKHIYVFLSFSYILPNTKRIIFYVKKNIIQKNWSKKSFILQGP